MRAGETDSAIWLKRMDAGGAGRARVFALPPAGAGAAAFRPWAATFPAGLELWAVRPPGREERVLEAAHTRILPLVEALHAVLTPRLDLPFVLFGHSMGALMAFELARLLRERGEPQPRHLFVSARRAPRLAPRDSPIHQLDDERFKDALRRVGGTPEGVLAHPEMMALLLPSLRADFEAVDTYTCTGGEPLEVPLTALGATHDPLVPVADLEGWRDETRGRFEARVVPGGHFFLASARDELVALVAAALEPQAG